MRLDQYIWKMNCQEKSGPIIIRGGDLILGLDFLHNSFAPHTNGTK